MKQKQVEEFGWYLRAGYPYFFISSSEMERTISLLSSAADSDEDKNGKKLYNSFVWDINGGPAKDERNNPRLPVDYMELLELVEKSPAGAVFFLKNFDWFLADEYGKPNKSVITFFQDHYSLFCTADRRKAIAIVTDADFEAVPAAIKKDFLPMDFDLPGEKEMGIAVDKIINTASKNPKFKKPDEKTKLRLIDACLGLTIQQAENALAYCLVSEGRLDPKVIDRIACKELEKIAGLSYVDYDVPLESVLGYDNIKRFTLGTINHPNSHGIILIGPCGTGKTMLTRAIGTASGRRVLEVEFAELQGGIVGDNERMVRELIRAVRAKAGSQGVIVLCDEIEKGLSGIGGQQSVSSDSINKRAMGQWLKFMSDPRCNVYFLGTCNDISSIPPEYLRAGRWDTAPFYVDLPAEDERKIILNYYRGKHNLNGKKKQNELAAKDTEGWSGAELEAVCNIAEMMNSTLAEAKNFVIPMSVIMKEAIIELEKWRSRTIPASTPVKGMKVKTADLDRYLDFTRTAKE